MKCQILFKGQIKTNVINLSTAEWLGLNSPRKQINRTLKPFLLIHVNYLDKKKM